MNKDRQPIRNLDQKSEDRTIIRAEILSRMVRGNLSEEDVDQLLATLNLGGQSPHEVLETTEEDLEVSRLRVEIFNKMYRGEAPPLDLLFLFREIDLETYKDYLGDLTEDTPGDVLTELYVSGKIDYSTYLDFSNLSEE